MAENRMELFIETLTGTAFELSCSPFETVVSIKAKIQYSEGIPVSQQHLIWKSQELNDDLCLQDYQITDGATLKLVLGMRGGPINTRQISDTKKLKDLADYVERRSETSGSGGRPFTVLVFHDGDKVHMYTLMERGDCTVSPVSGTISETSSIASLKNVEELDQDLIRENEITKEKISQLQEQIRALNINKSRRFQPSDTEVEENVMLPKIADDTDDNFHLPPLQRVDSIDPQTKQYSQSNVCSNIKKVENNYFSRFTPNVSSKTNVKQKLTEVDDEKADTENIFKSSQTSLDSITSKISLKSSTLPDKNVSDSISLSCSNFLPYIEPPQEITLPKNSFRNINASNAQCIGFSLNPIFKYDIPKVKYVTKQCPLTSSQALSSKKYMDLDHWIQNRPKTTPEESSSRTLFENELLCKNKVVRENRIKNKIKQNIKSPLSISLASADKSNLMMETYANHKPMPYDISSPIPYKNKANFVHSHSKTDVGTFLTAGLRALKAYSPNGSTEMQENFTKQKNIKCSPKTNNDCSRPNSGRKLPLIKAKKKSYKRCFLCSKRTGLATSYSCRCGKNFCAPHRYAEVHHCSYDYKTEGRRLLQLNNPVVAASKLPKI